MMQPNWLRHRLPPALGALRMFVIWRLVLWLIAGISLWYNAALYPYGRLLSWNGNVLSRSVAAGRILVDAWSIWDGDYYTAIALRGYTFRGVEWPSIPFFPLYPFLIRLILPLCGGNATLAAVLVANIAMGAAVALLHQLLLADFGAAVAGRSIGMMLVFPTSLFFAAGYSESLALALAVALAWALRRQHWWLAGGAGFLLALARLPGVLAGPIILLAYLDERKWRWSAMRWEVLASLLPAAGLGLFMGYQWRRFGTPLAFLQAQTQWEQRLSPPWVIPQALLQRIWSEGYPIYWLHLLIWALFIALAVAAWRRLPRAYGLIMLLLAPAYLGSWAFSIGRHVLIGFPAFVILAIWSEARWARWLLIAVSLPLLLICIALFVNTFWIA